ncbi:MAG: tripartite tricarboxylate transporter TctB [Tardiphaga sp.]|nr:tripartite tricarboxylate transporter TctB [Tardiphaga sp.]MDB5573002.1 tripartite tricarboxylate transporter TctB [Tardiphaga sp.]
MKLSDRVTGLFFCGLGGISAIAGSKLPPVPGQEIGPSVFPMVVGGAMALCGVMIAFGIGHKFEEEAEADLAAVGMSEPEPTRGPIYSLRLLVPPALLAFYVIAIDQLGFFLTAAAMVFVLSTMLGGRLRLSLPLALIAPIGLHLIFGKLLRVPLPAGLIPLPW